ncbi:MAG: T9SS type A sorting domain-containing protein [Lewinella sp.]|nr:T9SS type A sorting domain-containing protein [Lewinella sp.]
MGSESHLEQGATLEVTNLFGQPILQRQLGVIEQTSLPLDLSDQPPGVYVVRLRLADGRTEAVQLVKQ